MKKLILSILSAAIVVAPIAAVTPAAAQQRHTTTVVRETPRGTVVTKRTTAQGNARAWRKGQRFDRRYATNYREVTNYRSYRLSAPPRGYRWVRSGNDAVLVGITSGVIASVLANRIR